MMILDVTTPHRLHLGASRLGMLPIKSFEVFADPSWMNYGDESPARGAGKASRKIAELVRSQGWSAVPKSIWARLRATSIERPDPALAQTLGEDQFQAWRYEKGDSLEFKDETFSFIFSEHFFEHLFLDEAAALLRECHRVLKPGGVIRTVVPDADLRTDIPPEPIGFPSAKLGWDDPRKHKTRWSAYMLDEVLMSCGFERVWIRYCDKFGKLTELKPEKVLDFYPTPCDPRDTELVGHFGYIRRINSLIMDGVKPRVEKEANRNESN